MKKFLLIIGFFMSFISNAQMNSNIISKNDFFKIKIKNSEFREIRDSKGDLTVLNNLFGSQITESDTINDERYFYYKYDGFDICFSEDEIVKFKITKANWSITINGRTVSIGSHINDLGNPKINNQTNGRKSIIYQYCEGCNNYLAFDLDNNNMIIQIEFIEMT